jgi:hypothetical protein
MMAFDISYQENQLAGALYALGVNFVLGGKDEESSLHTQPNELIAALAKSSEARLRLSLIPLFLEHPEYEAYVCETADHLEASAQLTVQCYYSAAVFLAKKYSHLKITLPNHFTDKLNIPPANDPDESLRALATRHKVLSGTHVNWLATYHHAERVWCRGKVK